MSHRPWDTPKRPWVMSMQWQSLLFAHWAVKPAQLEPYIPKGLQLELYDGFAWLSVVPFQMRRTTPRGLFSLPAVSDFDELNLRTYVTDGKKRGVWFFSLDCSNGLAVRAARFGFHLPYMDAKMRVENRGEQLVYSSRRTHKHEPSANLECLYQPTGAVYHSTSGTFEHWLTERYCLYSATSSGQVFRGEIDHQPWDLQPAAAEFSLNSMAEGIGIKLSGAPQTLHYAQQISVKAWLLEPVN